MKQEYLEKIILRHFYSISNDEEKIELLNRIRLLLHAISPFKNEPVDCVLWVKAEKIQANDYNPNIMAPAERKLLKHSIEIDGFTQPVVVSEGKGEYLVVDGFHRQLIGKDTQRSGRRLQGYLPVTCINPETKGHAQRVAATIRHNRARGKHQIASMSDIVRDLSTRGWSDSRIALELGMECDEVLRLKQISGLVELFRDEDFSPAWTVL